MNEKFTDAEQALRDYERKADGMPSDKIDIIVVVVVEEASGAVGR